METSFRLSSHPRVKAWYRMPAFRLASLTATASAVAYFNSPEHAQLFCDALNQATMSRATKLLNSN